MNVLNNLVELTDQLPQDSTYRAVAMGILEHLPQMQGATIYDIADITNSSRTTVWRMVQKMGYHSFTEFNHALQNAVQQYAYYNIVYRLGKHSDCRQLIDKTANLVHNVADATRDYIEPEQIMELALHMHQKKRISLYLSLHFFEVSALRQNLSMDGKQTGLFCLLPEMLADAQTLDSDTLVLAYALEYAETMDLSPVFDAVRSQGAELWLVKGDSSRYLRPTDISILNPPPSTLGWSTLFEQFLLILSDWYRISYVERTHSGFVFDD